MTSDDAASHLRTIRQLMERATQYRSLSASGAAVGGLLSVGLAWWQHSQRVNEGRFLLQWLAVFGLVTVFNILSLKGKAASRGERLISPGFKTAIGSMWPALGSGFLVGLTFWSRSDLKYCVLSWVVFYGLALLATRHFAPRSIARLGWLFTVAGAFGFALETWGGLPVPTSPLLMGATFGLFHLFYSAAILIRPAPTLA